MSDENKVVVVQEAQHRPIGERMHPLQDINLDPNGTPRFRENKIVRDMLDFSQPRGMGMNEVAMRDYSRADRVQFAQLIGYSLGGFSELSYVSDDDYAAANARFEKGNDISLTQELEARNEFLRGKLRELQAGVQELADNAGNLGDGWGLLG